MAKAAIVVLADTETHEGLARVVNALVTAKELKESGDDAAVVFDGAGTRWVPELAEESHKAHKLYDGVQDIIAGACAYCSRAFGVKDQVEAAGVKLLDEYADHPSLRSYIAEGYQVVTF